jgi:23S rRNA (cytidine1920-2'-O)/16S rRNA (cytidine1409-2'-O)-methyltransferase
VKKVRADELLVKIGLAESRTQARKLILAGHVIIDGGTVLDKPSREFADAASLKIKHLPRYVSRGGEKLEGFFINYNVDLRNCNALDIGASTGGFTDYLLQHGVASVVCVDVGHGQLHYKLRIDKRVSNFERVNARCLSDIKLPRQFYDIIVIDVSFISLKKILQEAWKLLAIDGLLVALIKPQFEASKEEASRGNGIIADETIHKRICDDIREYALHVLPNCSVVAEVASQIKGTCGNVEFFIGLKLAN